MMRAALGVALLAGATAAAEPAAPRPAAALVVGVPGPAAARVDEARRQLSERYRLTGERALIEAPPADGADAARAALERAHQRLRRFDLPGVNAALADARAAAASLPPSDEGRALQAEIALREAELGLVQQDAARQEHAMALALSARPDLTLDPERESPPLVALLARSRAALERAPRATVRLQTSPPGAQLFLGGAARGATPVELSMAAAPQLAWLWHDGFTPRVERLAAGARLTVALTPLDARGRVAAAVAALRRAEPAHRREAAAALAATLGVESVWLLDGDGALAEAWSGPPPPAAPPASAVASAAVADSGVEARAAAPRPWYRRAWPWAVLGAAAVAAVAIGVGVHFGTRPPTVELTCCR